MKSTVLVSVLFVCFFMSTQSFAFRQDEYSIEISLASQDLSQRSVNDIFQDSNDFIWLLTQEGLNRFDGFSVVSFSTDRSDDTSISNQVTTSMAEDGNSTLWVGTLGGGLNRFNEANLSFTAYKALPSITNKNPVSNMISSLTTSRDGSLWVGYENGSGFSRFDTNNESFVHYFLPNQTPSAIVKAFVETEDGNLYIAINGSGIYRMDATTELVSPVAKKLTSGSEFPPVDITDMIQLKSGLLLVTSFSQGAFLYDPAKQFLTKHPIHSATNATTANQILTVMEDAEGNHWFGTDAGIVVYSPSGSVIWLTAVNTQLPEAPVIAMLQSRSGMMWIGTFNGLAQGTRSLFQKFTEEDGFSSSITYSIATDDDNKWWIGTSRGISSARPARDASGAWAITEPVSKLLEQHQIMTIEKQDNIIWAGSLNAGFFEVDLNAKSITQFAADGRDGSLSADGVPVVKVMPDGRVLVGTYGGGLNIYDPEDRSFQTLTSQSNDETTISDDRILSVLIDTRGQVWVGTQDGLNLFKPEDLTFRRFKFDPDDNTTLSSNTVFSLAEDQQGVLWVGTRSGGLNFLSIDAAQDKSPHFYQPSPAVGVPNADILGVLVDEQDNIWVSHNAGITRIDKSRQTSISFDVTAGLQAREFNQGAAHVGVDGSLFFGGQFGFNVIEPATEYQDSFEPKIQVTSFKLLNEHMYFDAPYSELQQINLDYDYQFASIDFAALDYRRPSAVRYRYRIDGIHNEWINLDQTRSVSISGLGFGNYKLRLSATNASGAWLERDREIGLNIAPPWWLTWYAYSAYATIIVYFIFFVFKQQQAKTKRELARRLELEERVEERTRDLEQARNDAEAAARAKSEFLAAMSHEIRTPMHGMIGMTDLLIESGLNAKQKSYALTAKDSGESLLSIINSILDYSKMEAEKLELDVTEFDIVTLIDNVSALLMQNALEHQTQLHVVWQDCQARKVSGDAGKVRQILINLIGNAIKFSKGGVVTVWCSTEKTTTSTATSDAPITFRICVEDNGIGIAEDKLESIFEVFTQADTSTTRQYGGTGLGLSISKELAALMGGSLTASSQLGSGSRFVFEVEICALKYSIQESSHDNGEVLLGSLNETLFTSVRSKLLIAGFTVQRLGVLDNLEKLKDISGKVIVDQRAWEKLASQDDGLIDNLIVLSVNNQNHPTRSNIQFVNPPFTQNDLIASINSDVTDDRGPMQSASEHTATPEIQSISIMVVEDVLVNQQIAMTMLNSLGASVDLACNGEEAVKLFQSKRYDVVFMDCQMPVLDGYQATAKIRGLEKQTKASRTTVIALTAGGDQNDKQRAHDAGMDGFLTKPFTTADLKQALSELELAPRDEEETSGQRALHADAGSVSTQDEILDLDVLSNLKTLDKDSGGHLIPKLMAGFSTQFAEKLTDLRSSIELKDNEALRTSAHAIKSMSANMGAKKVRAAAEVLEHGYSEFDFSKKSDVVSELKSHCEIYTSAAEAFFRR